MHRPRPTLFPYTTLFRSDPTVAREPAQAEAPLSDEDAEFLAEMAKLVARYVAEADDELQEATKQILALEKNPDRKSTRLNSSHSSISYAVFCLKKKKERE